MSEPDPYAAVPARPGLSAIVAVGRGGAIGRAGALPWHVRSELVHFKRVTMGHTLIVGSTTWHSIGRPLPGRRFVVLSRGGLDLPDGVERAGTPAEARARAEATDAAPVVAGGASVYAAFLPEIDRFWWSDVDVDVPGADTWLPELPAAEWADVARWPGEDPQVTYRVRDRRR